MNRIPHAYAQIHNIRPGLVTVFIDMADGTCFRLPKETAPALCLYDRVLVDMSNWEPYRRAHVVVFRANITVGSYGSLEVVSCFDLDEQNGLTMGSDAHR